uniref:Pleckstrin homology domain containing J1 n=1 Tax=Molossus molossus TaxID=27622 RepID=A0A7J8IB32_MOLMO|nr:pleckstrin homology domain containing J1 [Molossus molossus]
MTVHLGRYPIRPTRVPSCIWPPGRKCPSPVIDRLSGRGGAGAIASGTLPGPHRRTFLARGGTAAGRSRSLLRVLVRVAPCATTRRSCRRCPGSRPSWRPSWVCGAQRRAAPVGALLLEHCRVNQEEPSGFSISFIEDPERKYYFECCSEEQCQEWMGALRRARWAVGCRLVWGPGVGAEPGLVSTGHFLPQLRVHAQEPHLLSERDPEDDRQGPTGTVRHIRGGPVPAEWFEGMNLGLDLGSLA